MNQKYVNEIGKWPKSNFIYHLTERWCLKKEYPFKDKFQNHAEESELFCFVLFCFKYGYTLKEFTLSGSVSL